MCVRMGYCTRTGTCLHAAREQELISHVHVDSQKHITPHTHRHTHTHAHTHTHTHTRTQELMMSGWEPPATSGNRSAMSEANTTQDEERKSTAALKEQRQMESIKAKRRQELEQMVAYELKLTQVCLSMSLCVRRCVYVCMCTCVHACMCVCVCFRATCARTQT